MQHTSYYNDCKNKVKTAIADPKSLIFWTKTGGKRKTIIDFMSKINALTETYKSSRASDSAKNKAVEELKEIFGRVLMAVKQCKEYVEVRLMFMKMEDILIESGLDPTNIKEAMVEEESAGEQ